MQDKEVYKDPVYFEKLQNELFFSEGIVIDNYSDLLDKYDTLAKHIERFEELNAYNDKPKTVSFLGLPESEAILTSLKNVIYGRRRTYMDTFASQYFFSELECIRILQEIDVHAQLTGDFSIIGSNPLVGILGYDHHTIWETVFQRITSQKKYMYTPGEITYGLINKQRIDVNVYHPFVWYLLQTKQYDTLRLFSDPISSTHKKFLTFVKTFPARQEYKKKYYTNPN